MIQVAFAGHARRHDLGLHEPVSEALTTAFAMIADAGIGEARLLTGLASGADQLAARAWKRQGLGPIHAVLPFLDDKAPKRLNGAASAVTRLDGEAMAEQGRNPHLKQTRFIVEAADLLVAVWTGGPARGAGGTADAVQCALEFGLPVLWIRPSEPRTLRLIRPDALPSDFHFAEFQEGLQAGRLDHTEVATAQALRSAIDTTPALPDPEDEPGKDWAAAMDRWLHRWLWRTYANFRKLAGGRITGLPAGDPPPDLEAQPGFGVLTRAYLASDSVANRLSAVHRSEQILLVLAMIAAAVVGSAWAVWPQIKVAAVWTELVISVGALLVWAAGSEARQHERWSERRYLAEQLRLERAGWALGISVAGALPRSVRRQPGVWRDARRTAGLPDGAFDAERMKRWGDWSMRELVHGQRAYHHATSERDGRIAHRIHLLEDISFTFLFASFALYLSLASFGTHLPHWASGAIAMIGTIVPALAAASMALEAKLEFQEQSARSRRMAGVLEELAGKLGPDPSFDALQDAARAAVRLHIAEASHWREGSGRRRLLRA